MRNNFIPVLSASDKDTDKYTNKLINNTNGNNFNISMLIKNPNILTNDKKLLKLRTLTRMVLQVESYCCIVINK